MYMREVKFFCKENNVNYFVHSNQLSKPKHLACFLQFLTDIFENLFDQTHKIVAKFLLQNKICKQEKTIVQYIDILILQSDGNHQKENLHRINFK